jgi:hypothetical protein
MLIPLVPKRTQTTFTVCWMQLGVNGIEVVTAPADPAGSLFAIGAGEFVDDGCALVLSIRYCPLMTTRALPRTPLASEIKSELKPTRISATHRIVVWRPLQIWESKDA